LNDRNRKNNFFIGIFGNFLAQKLNKK